MARPGNQHGPSATDPAGRFTRPMRPVTGGQGYSFSGQQAYGYDQTGAGQQGYGYAGQQGQPGWNYDPQTGQPVGYGTAQGQAAWGQQPGVGAYQQPGAYAYQQGQPTADGYYAQPGYQPGAYPQQPYGYQHAAQPAPAKRKGGKGTVIAAVILMVVGLGLLAVALTMYLTSQHNYQQNEQEYTQLATQNVTEDPGTSEPVVDFAALQAENPEIVGWVQIPGTPVNYPVVQHDDNDYYLNHSFLGRDDEFGAIFMDYRSKPDLSGYTTVVYGHHLKNGNMFAKLADYSSQSEFDKLGDFYYVTDDGTVHVLTPLATMVVDGYDVDSVRTDFTDVADFTSYVQSLLDRASAKKAGATAQGVGHLYLLSTCSYARENDRTILIAQDKVVSAGAASDATDSLQQIQQAAGEAASAARAEG